MEDTFHPMVLSKAIKALKRCIRGTSVQEVPHIKTYFRFAPILLLHLGAHGCLRVFLP